MISTYPLHSPLPTDPLAVLSLMRSLDGLQADETLLREVLQHYALLDEPFKVPPPPPLLSLSSPPLPSPAFPPLPLPCFPFPPLPLPSFPSPSSHT